MSTCLKCTSRCQTSENTEESWLEWQRCRCIHKIPYLGQLSVVFIWECLPKAGSLHLDSVSRHTRQPPRSTHSTHQTLHQSFVLMPIVMYPPLSLFFFYITWLFSLHFLQSMEWQFKSSDASVPAHYLHISKHAIGHHHKAQLDSSICFIFWAALAECLPHCEHIFVGQQLE